MLEIGSLVDGKYKILNKIGQGGMSVVYLAMNEKANKQWAIKEVRKDGIKDFEVVRQGLVVETEMLKRLDHPNLPSIIDVIEDESKLLIVMDYIQGNPLSKDLEEFGAQPQEYVIEWAKQLCDVLGYLHTRDPGIIYRDMKPSNVMLRPDSKLTLVDFGTAREFKEKNLADTTCLGTIGYAAPEQFGGQGQTDGRTDIYCLGATLYHLVTGCNPCEPPYEIKPIREINPSLSSGLEGIIKKCTQRNPDDRYQSAAELMYALEHYEEIDDIHRKKLKRKLGAFITSVVLTVSFLITSVWGYTAAEARQSQNYDVILKNASNYQDYYTAILTDTTRTEAYFELNSLLINDFELSSEEASIIRKLVGGLDETDTKGYSSNIDVLSKLKASNQNGYGEVCYKFGETYLFYYDVAVEKDRYSNAAIWFENVVSEYPIAQVYCDISSCLDSINQYNNAKVKQTDKMYEQYKTLWEKIGKLKSSADTFDDIDSKLQVWSEIVDMITNNITPFLEVTTSDEVTSLLDEISNDASKVTKTVIMDDINKLQEDIAIAKSKVKSVKD